MTSLHDVRLNTEQARAVGYAEGPLLIFAGAGSGKTRVLTCRIANLIERHGVRPEHILAVTFTNKAAREMRERVQSLLGCGLGEAWVSTFHASCVRILRRHAALLDFSPQFAIYDRSESLSVLKRVYRKLDIDPKLLDLRSMLQFIDQAKNSYRTPDQTRTTNELGFSWEALRADVYEGYQQELQSSNAMDFGDLLCNVVTLFRLEPALLAQYRDRFRQVLVDEYQDTNHVQYLLIKLLTEEHRSLCVVGDDDQSIYAFRGASVENILSFQKDFPEAEVVILEENYRSSRNILTAANAVIAKNRGRKPKQMRTANAPGEKVLLYCAHDERDEADFVVRRIRELIELGALRSEIAVFYRTNAQSRAIEEAFCAAGMPYEIFGGHRFYDRKEIKDVLAYFRLGTNPRDNEAFLRVVNCPTRGLGEAVLTQVTSHASRRGMPLLEAAAYAAEAPESGLSALQRKRLLQFVQLVAGIASRAQSIEERLNAEELSIEERSLLLPELLNHIAEASDYLPRLRKEDTPEAESRIENIRELAAVASEFTALQLADGGGVSLHSFLDRASLASDLDREELSGESGAVSMMTLHLAKGLEFRFVFLTGMEEGVLPHIRSIDSRSALEEERRLCYVGITRAREQLFLSAAARRGLRAQTPELRGAHSRFLDDLPAEVLLRKRSAVLDGGGYAEESEELQYRERPRYLANAPVIRRAARG